MILLWLRYVDDTFTAVRHDEIDAFQHPLNRQTLTYSLPERSKKMETAFSKLPGKPWRQLTTDNSLQETETYRLNTGQVTLPHDITQSHNYLDSYATSATSMEAPFLTARDLGANIARALKVSTWINIQNKHGGSMRSHYCYLKRCAKNSLTLCIFYVMESRVSINCTRNIHRPSTPEKMSTEKEISWERKGDRFESLRLLRYRSWRSSLPLRNVFRKRK